MHGEALCAPGLQSRQTLGNACTILWAIEFLPEDLWTRNMLCPTERAAMLGATSKRVRALMDRLQRGLQAAVRVSRSASMQSVLGGMRGQLPVPSRNARMELRRQRKHCTGR